MESCWKKRFSWLEKPKCDSRAAKHQHWQPNNMKTKTQTTTTRKNSWVFFLKKSVRGFCGKQLSASVQIWVELFLQLPPLWVTLKKSLFLFLKFFFSNCKKNHSSVQNAFHFDLVLYFWLCFDDMLVFSLWFPFSNFWQRFYWFCRNMADGQERMRRTVCSVGARFGDADDCARCWRNRWRWLAIEYNGWEVFAFD